MFDLFSWSHILILLVVALVVVGPKDLPRLMRTAGQWAGKARAMANEFRQSFDEMARQSELDELRKEIENLRAERPFADVHAELNKSIIPDDMKSAPAVAAEETMTPVETPPINHSKIDEEPQIAEPEHVADLASGRPPAP
jgi:sec-independent protein translocase protein TatB